MLLLVNRVVVLLSFGLSRFFFQCCGNTVRKCHKSQFSHCFFYFCPLSLLLFFGAPRLWHGPKTSGLAYWPTNVSWNYIMFIWTHNHVNAYVIIIHSMYTCVHEMIVAYKDIQQLTKKWHMMTHDQYLITICCRSEPAGKKIVHIQCYCILQCLQQCAWKIAWGCAHFAVLQTSWNMALHTILPGMLE